MLTASVFSASSSPVVEFILNLTRVPSHKFNILQKEFSFISVLLGCLSGRCFLLPLLSDRYDDTTFKNCNWIIAFAGIFLFRRSQLFGICKPAAAQTNPGAISGSDRKKQKDV